MRHFCERTKSLIIGMLLPMLLALPQVLVASHIPILFDKAESERHWVLGAAGAEDAGHTHDEGTPEEQQLNHLHGHNLADHAHESAHPPYQGLPRLVSGQIWHRGYRCACSPPHRLPLERPPRPARFV